MKRIPVIMIVSVILASILFMPQGSVKAASCYGSTCFGKNPATYTNSKGTICSSSSFAYTVQGSFTGSGTNGTVKVELRYSDPTLGNSTIGYGCQANWSRATVTQSNSNTKQLAAKAYETNRSSFRDTRYIQGSPLGVNASVFSYMINGSVDVTAVAAIAGTFCSLDYGDPDTTCSSYYNPRIRYNY
jgi:hypothetical protein